MLILNAPQKLPRSGTLEIPQFQRGHLSLKSGTEVTMCLLPRRERSSGSRMHELVVSPIRFDSWNNLWRVTARLRERPGVVHQVLDVLRSEGFNILTEESSSIENRILHSLELIVDGRQNDFTRNLKPREVRLRSLEKRLIAICFDDVFLEGGVPQLRVERLRGLGAASRRHGATRNDIPAPVETRCIVKHGTLTLPSQILRVVRASGVQAITVSDTEERILRVFFTGPKESLLPTRIAHLDEVGALAAITSKIATSFDILTSLTRIHAQGSQNHLELLLKHTDSEKGLTVPQQKRALKDLLRSQALAHLDLAIGHPTSVRLEGVRMDKVKSRKQQHDELIPNVLDERKALLSQSTTDILNSKLRAAQKRRERTVDSSKRRLEESRIALLRKLLGEEGAPSSLRDVFVSYQFDREDLFTILSEKAVDIGLNLLSGKELFEKPALRASIMERMRGADGFVGIWTGVGKEINPWLLWELGVAEAFGLPVKLLISEGVDSNLWKRVRPEQQHAIFVDTNFAKKVPAVLGSLRAEMQGPTTEEEEDDLLYPIGHS